MNVQKEEQIQAARSANLADYFNRSGYNLERHGNEIYVKEFVGLCVNENTNQWYNHYESVGGNNAVDCLVKVCGYDFKQAVYELTGREIGSASEREYNAEAKIKPEIKQAATVKKLPENATPKEFKLPERADNMKRVFAYFCKERKIPQPIIEELVRANLLYQSAETFETETNPTPQKVKVNNAIFPHFNENGEAFGGEVQGVTSYKRYKGLVAGTGESVFSFTPKPAADGKIKTAYLFESTIDLMSFYAFCNKEKMEGVALISMAGLKPSVPKLLQDAGVKVLSCVDNDEAGRKFEADNNFKRLGSALEKAGVKDWNDLLKLKVANPNYNINSANEIAPEINKNVRRKS